MADFMSLMLGYILFCIVCFCIYVFWEEPWLQKSLIVTVLRGCWKTLWRFTPRILRSGLLTTIEAFFYQRNHLFQILYAVMVAGGHMVLVLEVLPVLYHNSWEENHVFLPLLFAFFNGLLYAGTVFADPGTITEKSCYKFAEVYTPDRILYQANTRCGTCNIVKPARSKHCAVCDHCIHRFDHHCVWTNCCIGGMNYRYFLGFLFTQTLMCGNAGLMGFRALAWHAASTRLWEAQWMNEDGILMPMTAKVLVQHLFMQYPRIVFLIMSMFLLALVLGAYCFYHAYLVICNQTTNERYKWSRFLSQQLGTTRRIKCDSYDRGLWENLREVFQPYRYLNKEKVYRSKWR